MADFQIEDGILVKYLGEGGTVAIPQGVKSIGDFAFHGCESLESVAIPQGVETIGSWAFEDCASLASVSIPEGVQKIGEDAFNGCDSLSSVRLAGSVIPKGFPPPGPQTALLAPAIGLAECPRGISKVSLAAGRVLLAMAGEVPELGADFAEYARSQADRVCEALGSDASAVAWMASESLLAESAATTR